MDEKLILNDGTEIQGHLIVMDNMVFLYMSNFGFEEAFYALKEPDNVEVIHWERFGKNGNVSGYTNLYALTE